MSDTTFRIHASSESPARMRVSARSFTLVLDEPKQLGGTDQGPNPVEYVLAALAGCLNVTGHLVAREMGFTLRGLEVDAEGTLNPDRLLNRPTQDRAGFKAIRVTLQVEAETDNATLERWREAIEQRCPVSDNLGAATPVEVRLRTEG